MYQNVLYFLNEDTNTLEEGVIDSIRKAISKITFKIKYSARFKDLIKDIKHYIKKNPKASDDELARFAAKKIETFVGYFSFDSLYNLATLVRNADDDTIEDLKQDEILTRLTALVMQSVTRLDDSDINEKEALILKKIAEFASIPWKYTKDKFGTAVDWAKDGHALYEYDEETIKLVSEGEDQTAIDAYSALETGLKDTIKFLKNSNGKDINKTLDSLVNTLKDLKQHIEESEDPENISKDIELFFNNY